MKRITGRYGALKAATTSLKKIDGIDYRIASVDGAIVLAFDHKNGIVISTGFYEVSDFNPTIIRGKQYPSDYHEMVQREIAHHIIQDKKDDAAADAYSERLHP
jgi:hypothetical protein